MNDINQNENRDEFVNKSKIISITNQKGGVGKTTTSINLSASLCHAKKRVLLIDLDPQGNATMGSGIDKNDLAASLNDILVNEASVETVLKKTGAGFDILPANASLTAAEVKLLGLPNREYYLKNILTNLRSNYDFIFIDCPPALNILTINALVASDSVLIPIQCEYYALEGLAGLLSTIENLRNTINPHLVIEGILRTMYDGRNRLALDVSEQLSLHFADKLYNTIIPRNVRLAEAPSHGLPAILYDKNSFGAISYLALAGEILRRNAAVTDEKN